MKKWMKWTLGILLGLFVAVFALFKYMQSQTKKASPEEVVAYTEGDRNISVFYNRPSKRGRVIFGELVPYGTTWRTGANEATTFTTATDLQVGSQTLPAGKYTLWTVPGPEQWTVVFNSGEYSWGLNWEGKASRDPAQDVLLLDVPVKRLNNEVEMFTIRLEGSPLRMILEWDLTAVEVPLE